jgi:hypothetical protein
VTAVSIASADEVLAAVRFGARVGGEPAAAAGETGVPEPSLAARAGEAGWAG